MTELEAVEERVLRLADLLLAFEKLKVANEEGSYRVVYRNGLVEWQAGYKLWMVNRKEGMRPLKEWDEVE
jgi:hypothetical protein